MGARRSKKTYRRNKIFLIVMGALISVLILASGAYFYYESRGLPDLDEEHSVTELPHEVSRVLGTGVGPNKQQIAAIRVPVLLYHYVEYVHNDPGRQNLNIPPNVLTAQIETLKNAGYTFMTPNDLTDAILGKRKLPPKVVILSCDDGYMDFYTDVFPILKKEQVKAVAYVVPNFLNRPNYMFTFQLQDVAKSSLVEVGAHTTDHVWLAGMNKKQAANEVAQSRKTLQDMLHVSVNSLAYPYGAFDQQTIQIAKDAGFTNAVSTVPGILQTQDSQYFIYRLRPGYRTGQTLLDFLAQDSFKPW